MDTAECFKGLIKIEVGEETRGFHVWALSVGKLAMTSHATSSNTHLAIEHMTDMLRE